MKAKKVKNKVKDPIDLVEFKPTKELWAELLERAGNDEELATIIGKSWKYYEDKTNGKEDSGQ